MDSLDCPEGDKYLHYADLTCYLLYNILNTNALRFMQNIVVLFVCTLPAALNWMLKKIPVMNLPLDYSMVL